VGCTKIRGSNLLTPDLVYYWCMKFSLFCDGQLTHCKVLQCLNIDAEYRLVYGYVADKFEM